MARSWFGGTHLDVVLRPYRFGNRTLADLAANVKVTFHDAETGGVQVTDLLDVEGSPINSVVADADGFAPRFQGPDGVTTLWADAGGRRFLMVTTDGAIDLSTQLSTRIPTTEKGAIDGVATLGSTGKLVEPVPAANVEPVPADAAQVASYREGAENLFAGTNSATVADKDKVWSLEDPDGSRNTALGAETLMFNDRGWKNTAVGFNAMRENIDGYRCTAVGNDALRENVGGMDVEKTPTDPGSRNTAVGDLALTFNTTGYANTAVGVDAAQTNETGHNNTAVGYIAYSGVQNETTQHRKHAHNNTAVGSRALHFTATDGLTGADGNTAVGTNALRDNVTGASNVAVGLDSSATVDAVSDATAVGARSSAGHDRAVAIGADTVTSGPDQVAVGERNIEISSVDIGPGNGPAGSVRLFAIVSGGKVVLRARFPSGSPVDIVSEP